MQSTAGFPVVEGLLSGWVAARPEPAARVPVSRLGDAEVAAELAVIQRNRAREAAREAELILRLAQLRPDAGDRPVGRRGARSRTWRRSEPEFPGVSEFFPDELAHALNVGRGGGGGAAAGGGGLSVTGGRSGRSGRGSWRC